MVLVPWEEGMPYKKVFLDRNHRILGFSRNISSENEMNVESGNKAAGSRLSIPASRSLIQRYCPASLMDIQTLSLIFIRSLSGAAVSLRGYRK